MRYTGEKWSFSASLFPYSSFYWVISVQLFHKCLISYFLSSGASEQKVSVKQWLQAHEYTVLILSLLTVSHTYGTLETVMCLESSLGWTIHWKTASKRDRFIPVTHKGHGSDAVNCTSPFHSSNYQYYCHKTGNESKSTVVVFYLSLSSKKRGCRDFSFPGLCYHNQLINCKEKSGQCCILL